MIIKVRLMQWQHQDSLSVSEGCLALKTMSNINFYSGRGTYPRLTNIKLSHTSMQTARLYLRIINKNAYRTVCKNH